MPYQCNRSERGLTVLPQSWVIIVSTSAISLFIRPRRTQYLGEVTLDLTSLYLQINKRNLISSIYQSVSRKLSVLLHLVSEKLWPGRQKREVLRKFLSQFIIISIKLGLIVFRDFSFKIPRTGKHVSVTCYHDYRVYSRAAVWFGIPLDPNQVVVFQWLVASTVIIYYLFSSTDPD